MVKTSTTITPTLWSRKDKDGLYPIKIRITTNRKSEYRSIGHSIKKSDWSKSKKRVKTTNTEYKEINYEIEKELKTLEKVFIERGMVSFNRTNVFEYTENYIRSILKKNKYYSAKRYKTLLNHLESFTDKTLEFYDIDKEFLLEFRTHLEDKVAARNTAKGNSPNSINNYLKTLSSIINKAIADGTYVGINPFVRGIIPQKTSTTKITLNPDELFLLDNLHQDYPGLTEGMWDAVSVFMFSFWSQGLRIGDVLRLKYGNVIGDSFQIEMKKVDKFHTFPLSHNNVFRLIQYIPDVFPVYDWEFRSYNSLSDVYYSEIAEHDKLLTLHRIYLHHRENLLKTMNQMLPTYNQKRFNEDDTIGYLEKEWTIHSRGYWKAFSKSKAGKDVYELTQYRKFKNDMLAKYLEYFIEFSRNPKNESEYVFPFLRGIDPKDELSVANKVSSTTALINKNLHKLSALLGINPFSTHYARHTFATISKDLGGDIYDLKSWLGHSSVKITEAYINSLDHSRLEAHRLKMEDYLLNGSS